jgi:hypothetical protein
VNTLTAAIGLVTIVNFGYGPEDAAIMDDTLSGSNISGKVALYFLCIVNSKAAAMIASTASTMKSASKP